MFVFVYGSLSGERGAREVASLRGFIRSWDVAMDNRVDIPGYKYYVDPVTHERPAVHVTFLNLTPDPHTDAVGFLLPVDPGQLARLDRRERNYDRVEVSDRVLTAQPLRTRVYTYLGTPQARERYTAAELPVIARAYKEQVETGFREHTERYERSTRPPACPVRDLARVNLPQAAGRPAPGPAAA